MSTDFWVVINGRRSIRAYKKKPVARGVLEDLIKAASAAPSAHNCQPWHFVVITSSGVKKRLAVAMAKRYEQDMVSQGAAPEERDRRTRRSIELFQAPVIIIPFLVARENRQSSLCYKGDLERVMLIQSVALAAGQLLLAAEASGLSACWFAAPIFCPEVVREHLNISRSWEPQALITVGYPAETPPPRARLSLPNVCTFIS